MAAKTLTFDAPIRLQGASAGTEPRVVVGPDNRRWVITNADSDGSASVYVSDDHGLSWHRTEADPAGQSLPTIDVDVAVLPMGRVIASELDSAGLNFPTSYSDDGGKTWTQSVGSSKLVDQDRQWLAVGPNNPVTGAATVHLLYHNLASGLAAHNMWVTTSIDGGAHFGAPVPITLPGQQAFLDLQCGDSGGPSSLSVNPKTGRLYAVFATRSSIAGGCAAQPVQVNVVGATRVWVATSPDNTPGTWTQSLAVDDSISGSIVSMQLSPGTLDREGNLWLVYPESPRPYPDYSGAAIKVIHAGPDLSRWSQPLTLVAGGTAGNLLPHIVVGDPGRLAVAYFHGEGSDKQVRWFTHVVSTQDALADVPSIEDQRISRGATYQGSASSMMGACASASAISGLENGLNCGRSTDVWGMALDADCRITVVWPSVDSSNGTYVATQSGGDGLCDAH